MTLYRPFLTVLAFAALPSAIHSQEVQITDILNQRLHHDSQLTQIRLTFTDHAKRTSDESLPDIALTTEVAVKGEKRFFEVTPSSSLPAELETQFHRAMSYNGEDTSILMMDGRGAIFPGDIQHEVEPADCYLSFNGYPRSNYRIKPRGRKGISCDIQHLLQSGNYEIAGRTTVDGISCITVASLTDRLFFSEEQAYALVARELIDSESGRIWLRLLLRDLTEVHPDMWLAQQITTEVYSNEVLQGSRVTQLEEYSVTDVPDSLFTMQFAPGTSVADIRHFPPTPEGNREIVAYDIPTSPDELDAIVAAAVEEKALRLKPPGAGPSRSTLLFGINLFLLTLLAFLIYIKKRRQMAGG